MKKLFISFIFSSSILFSMNSKAMCDYSNGDLFWQKLPGIAFHWCDSLPAGYRIKTMADKDKNTKKNLKQFIRPAKHWKN
jgi:hypothetical protein